MPLPVVRRACCLLLVLAGISPASRSAAQNPPDLVVTLVTTDGRTTFRMGETIDVQLRVRAAAPQTYQYHRFTERRVWYDAFEQFVAEPAAGVVDPRADVQYRGAGGGSGPSLGPFPLGATELVLERQVNDWLRLPSPGQYRVTAETSRFARTDGTMLRLRSNTIEIEITPRDAAQDAAVLRQASEALAPGPVRLSRQARVTIEELRRPIRAVVMLAHLGTEGAADALAGAFVTGDFGSAPELTSALFTSPHRQRIVTALEGALRDPAIGIGQNFLDTLVALAAGSAAGSRFAGDAADRRWREAAGRARAHYGELLAAALPLKVGPARAATMDTLLDPYSDAPLTSDQLTALIEVFEDVPSAGRYLTSSQSWARVAQPAFYGLLERLAAGTGPLRDPALTRLSEADPAAARPIVLQRIAGIDLPSGFPPTLLRPLGLRFTGAGSRSELNPDHPSRMLLQLADPTRPDLDAPLVGALEEGRPVELLIARYASAGVRDRLRPILSRASSACADPLLLYFFRVEPAYAASLVASERTLKGEGACPLPVTGVEDLLMSPGFEQAAIADVVNAVDPGVVRHAQTVLERGGTGAAARDALWDGLSRLRAREGARTSEGLEMGFVRALTTSAGWTLTPDDMDRLARSCVTEGCREEVSQARQAHAQPVAIRVGGLRRRVGITPVGSSAQLAQKIRQFPPGTAFRLEWEIRRPLETPWGRQQADDVRNTIAGAGMSLDEPPSAPLPVR